MTEETHTTPWGLVVLLGALTALGPLAIDMYLPSLPTIGAELHASAAQTQATVAAFLAGMAIGQLFYGPASDRFGRKPPILLGLAIYVAASAGCALAVSAPALIGLRFLQALGACAGAVVSRAVVRDRFDHAGTARMLSLMVLIMGLAPIFAPLIGGALLTLTGWRSIFGFMTLAGALVAVAVLLRLEETRSAETAAHARSEHPIRAYLNLLRNRRLVGYAAAAALNGATLFTYISSSPDLLIGAYHISPGAFGWVFGLNAVGVIAASQWNRRLLRRFTPDEVLERAAYAGVAAALLLTLAAVTGWGERWSVLPTLFLALATYGLMQGNTMAGALNVDPRRAGSISALMGAFSFAAGAAATGVAGLMHDGTARPMAVVMLISMAGSALALRGLALPKKP
ncbi:multidrug effflux MFS transporter [Phenylobacterium sp. LjRoot225]|uniref:multidrug effflux MFS transporter n=1 Tax=Phenylobacterium sp. LjRoot225 TaxID=3342285 RepID=UPI003ECD88D8